LTPLDELDHASDGRAPLFGMFPLRCGGPCVGGMSAPANGEALAGDLEFQ
jgi:hypothetical protein